MRLKILKFIFILALFLIIVRLFYWQVIRYDDMSARAEQQHLVSYTLDGPRGVIFSSDGSVLVANKPTFLMYGLPKVIKDKEQTAAEIAKIIFSTEPVEKNSQAQIDKTEQKKRYFDLKQELLDKLSQDLYWVSLQKNIELPVKKEIEKLKIVGIGFENQLSRFYPEASSAAHVLGFVGLDPLGKQIGYFGVEGFYNGELKGIGGMLTEEKDAGGLPILSGTFLKKEPRSGHSLILNIDRTVQYIVEKKLIKGIEKYSAKSGLVIVMEPSTGAILAMASYPNYDPGRYGQFPKEVYKNPSVADSYEPGSTFKVLVMAAAINEGLIKPDTRCDDCDGPIKIADYEIKTWNNKYYPDSTMTDVLVHSDNTGMVFVGRKLGLEKSYQYLQNFGFGATTQIDLQDEVSPDLRTKAAWKEIDLATSSFGQGIAVTPIQMIRAIAAIASGGKLMEPHIVKAIGADDKLEEIKPKVVGQPISNETASIVAQMMVEAVEEGEAKAFISKGYKIAGKTGTAQIPVAGHYDPTKTIASFVGFAPADRPKFVMLVKYTEPSASIFGAETAAPTFFDIAKELLIYYNIAPSN